MSYCASDQNLGGFEDMENSFSEKAIRRGFIRKVFSILMCQLVLTAGIITLFFAVEPIKMYARENRWMFWVAFALTFVILIVLSCCGNVRRQFPQNIILLFFFTLVEGFLLGTITSVYDTQAVLIAVGICAVVCLGLTIFAFQTKIDFTVCSGCLFVAFIVFFLFGMIALIIPGKTIIILYSAIGALLFSVYIVVDIQMMVGQKHRYSISPEEYIFGALNLYLDIINLFLMILNLVQLSGD